jgi:hypothetical protein
MTARKSPPSLATRILRAALPFSKQRDILGDLEEIFQAKAGRSNSLQGVQQPLRPGKLGIQDGSSCSTPNGVVDQG